ncbi:MAG TPA: hypothetical protein VEL72_06905 [Ktedonobacteraceae bacterium]|nr:hypothetical protein [Ktedonobacteraceae bacterium]
MKTVYSYQEIGELINQGQPVAFTRQLEVRVTARRNSPESDTITALIRFCHEDYLLGEVENEYATIAILLKVFAIGELEDIWQVPDCSGIER